MSNFRIGQGFDAHKIIKGTKDFVLGGIQIDSNYEVIAHSDRDIVCHAIIDALLGACNLGDIGELAPSNEQNKDISCKATTTDGLGYEGALEGISAQAVALVIKT